LVGARIPVHPVCRTPFAVTAAQLKIAMYDGLGVGQ
jgi:hypothetical protein